MNVSVATLHRMEGGDASGSMAMCVVALWLMLREGFLPGIADPGGEDQARALQASRTTCAGPAIDAASA